MSPPRVVFENVPESWRKTERSTYLEYALEPGLVVVVPNLAPLPEDVAYFALTPERDLPKDAASVKVLKQTEHKSAVEWPMVVWDSVALSASQAVVEARLHLVIYMIEHATIISVRARSVEQLAAREAEIMAVCDTVRPDWGNDPSASLRDLLAP